MPSTKNAKVIGIDPGLTGAIVSVYGDQAEFYLMPLNNNEIDFDMVRIILGQIGAAHVFLERAVPFSMGTKGAFNYGRGFMAIEIAVKLSKYPVTYLEPAKWAKVMHAGIDSNLKAKAKSVIAIERLLPQFVEHIPKTKTGKMHEGIVDALLIAGYGARSL